MERVQDSSTVILASTFVFHLIGFIYCIRQRSSKAVFTNSKLILICAIIFDLIEIFSSIALGECIVVWKCSTEHKLYLGIVIIFASNSFYMANLLRAHRLLMLSSLESGDFSLHHLSRIRLRLDDLWYILMIVGGTFIVSCPYSSYLIYQYHSNPSVLVDIKVYELFVGTTVSAECLLFISLLIPLYRRPIPIILKVELSFQVFAWSCALYVMRNPVIQRLLYLVPIRNTLMMMLIIMSVYEINKNFKPPLPPDIDLELVLETEELYLAFRKFLEKREMNEAVEILNILLKIRIYKESYEKFDSEIIEQAIMLSEGIGYLLKDTMIESLKKGEDEGFRDIEDICYEKLKNVPFKLFKTSEEFIDTLSEY